jgi:5-(carboxyamino)imidazole ribonucleotide mutase
LEENEKSGDKIVYITIAGMSNALSGFVDANTRYPVIACPPQSGKLDIDIYSSLRMPSGVAPVVILNPKNAALSAAKIFGMENPSVSKKVVQFQLEKRKEVVDTDKKWKVEVGEKD